MQEVREFDSPRLHHPSPGSIRVRGGPVEGPKSGSCQRIVNGGIVVAGVQYTAKRTVTFYECVNGFGSRIDPPIDFEPVLGVVEGLYPDTKARFTARDGTSFHVYVFRSTTGSDLLAVARTRAAGWPRQEQGGHYSEVAAAPNANLAEVTHVAFFDRSVVGSCAAAKDLTLAG